MLKGRSSSKGEGHAGETAGSEGPPPGIERSPSPNGLDRRAFLRVMAAAGGAVSLASLLPTAVSAQEVRYALRMGLLKPNAE